MADTLRNVITRAGEILRSEGKEATDPQLKELTNDALDFVKLYFQSRGVNFITQEQDISVTAGVTALDVVSHPALFNVMQRPIALSEKPAGTTYWVPMRLAKDHLPYNATQVDKLAWWEWKNSKIYLVGSTSTCAVRVKYIGDLANLAIPTDTISYPDLVSPLAHKVASLAQGGNEFHESTCTKLLELISRADGRIEQQRPFRRVRRVFGIPYRRY